jgi:hypothetical protein
MRGDQARDEIGPCLRPPYFELRVDFPDSGRARITAPALAVAERMVSTRNGPVAFCLR